MLTYIKKIFNINKISESSVYRAYRKVRKELAKLGILTDDLFSVKVIWQKYAFGALLNLKYFECEKKFGSSSVHGFCITDENNIYIPAYAYNRKSSTLDILRHEYAHIIANIYPNYFKTKMFINSFGDTYCDQKVFDEFFNPESCITEYAYESIQEDFAETFMLYLKYKGELPFSFRKNNKIKAKWKFIEHLVKRLKARKK